MSLSSETGGQLIAPVGTFWIIDLAQPLPPALSPRLPTTFLRFDQADAGELAQTMRCDDETVRRRFDAGKHCYGGKIENEIATYGWVTFDQEHIGELGLTIHLASGDVYIWDCATLPTYRGLRLYAALLSYIVSTLHALGLRRIWIGADADNLPSQAGMIRAGFQPVIDMVLAPASSGLRLRGRPGTPEQLVSEMRAALR